MAHVTKNSIEDRALAAIKRMKEHGRTALHLVEYLLEQIPEPLYELRELRELNLQGNQLRTWPTKLGRLQNLRQLDVRRNPLSSVADQPGLILDWPLYEKFRKQLSPENIAGLALDCQGEFPQQLYDLPNLEVLDFSVPHGRENAREYINGIDFTRFPRLRRLELFYCGLQRLPDCVAAIPNLVHLDLRGNPITAFPDQIASRGKLTRLYLHDMGLESVPRWVFRLNALVHLSLGHNCLRSLLGEVRHLRSLRFLDISHNPISELPASFARLEELTELVAENCSFAEFPRAVLEMQNLQHLWLGCSPITCISWTRNDQAIKHWCDREGTIRRLPAQLAKLERLEQIELDGQPITDPPKRVWSKGTRSIRDYFRKETEPREVYVSYAHGKGSESERIAEQLTDALTQRGIGVFRDKQAMKYRDSISEFTHQLGRGTRVLVILSQKYFRSEFCMSELLEINKTGAMRKRIFPVVLNDAGLHGSNRSQGDWVSHIAHWEQQKKRINEEVKRISVENMETLTNEARLYSEIARTIGSLITVLRDMNAPNADDLRSDFAGVVQQIISWLDKIE